MTRGTMVGWAPQQDTDSARIRWWLTAGSILPRPLESTGIPPAQQFRNERGGGGEACVFCGALGV